MIKKSLLLSVMFLCVLFFVLILFQTIKEYNACLEKCFPNAVYSRTYKKCFCDTRVLVKKLEGGEK